jgi:hypothetical protein
MADTYTVVDLIDAVKEGVDETAAKVAKERRGADRVISVRFVDGRVGLLDLTDPRTSLWMSVLRSLQERKRPAYVEIDARTHLITQLLQPKLQPVGDIRPLDKGPDLQVELLNSHARHILRRKHPRFTALLKLLRSAQKEQTLLWVTETLDTHEIIDVRPASRAER